MRVTRETAMAMIVVDDGPEEEEDEELEEEVLLDVLVVEVKLIAVVEKSEPVMLRMEPGAGSCLQPASSARRTNALLVSSFEISELFIMKHLQFAVYVDALDCRQLTQSLMLVP